MVKETDAVLSNLTIHLSSDTDTASIDQTHSIHSVAFVHLLLFSKQISKQILCSHPLISYMIM